MMSELSRVISTFHSLKERLRHPPEKSNPAASQILPTKRNPKYTGPENFGTSSLVVAVSNVTNDGISAWGCSIHHYSLKCATKT